MKLKLLFVAILVACLFIDVSAEVKIRRRKKIRTTVAPKIETPIEPEPVKNQEITDETKVEVPLMHTESNNDEMEVPISEGHNEKEELDKVAQQIIFGYRQSRPQESGILDDPCSLIQCSAGMVCELDTEGEAICNCISECPFEVEERRRVCSNHNETFGSDCEVHRQRCLCMKKLDGCKGPEYSHVQVEYYGTCRTMPDCTPEEIADFPRRMRDWLFYIMRDLADRHELSEHYMKLEKESENNYTRGWINAAIWKWCDLDADDNNRFVSRHELFPIRAPLMSLEHCIAPFLNSCDFNGDHRITLLEWGKCLELDENELTDRCEFLSEENDKEDNIE